MKVHNETQLRGLIPIQHVVYLQRLDKCTGRQLYTKQATSSGFILQNKHKSSSYAENHFFQYKKSPHLNIFYMNKEFFINFLRHPFNHLRLSPLPLEYIFESCLALNTFHNVKYLCREYF